MRSPTRFTSASSSSGVLRREEVISLQPGSQGELQQHARTRAAPASGTSRSTAAASRYEQPPHATQQQSPFVLAAAHWRSSSAVPLAAARLPSMRRSVRRRQNASTRSLKGCDAMLLRPLLLALRPNF